LPGTVLTEPAGERHDNRFQQAGARVLVIEPDPTAADLWRSCRRLFDEAGAREDARIAGLARRAAAELHAPDDAAPLALEGLAFEILAAAARNRRLPDGSWPSWLARAQELLHDRALDRLRLTQLAALVGVHPATLARLFRARFRTSVGAYQRQLRLEWAGRRLSETQDTLAHIALKAGFADQSHFTRAFTRYAGMSPGRYRQTRAPGGMRRA
jgi:AraC-like DNA-binding protein